MRSPGRLTRSRRSIGLKYFEGRPVIDRLERVRRSAMGSVMLMRRPSPARLGETGNLTTAGDLADLHPREAELAVHAARATGDGATVALPRGTGIARLRLQLRLRRHALLGRALGAADQLLELGPLHRVFFHDPGATLLALDHARLRHRLFGFLLLPEIGRASCRERV